VSLEALGWPLFQAGEALEALARQSGLLARAVPPAPPPPWSGETADPGRDIEAAAERLGVEVEPVGVFHGEAGRLVRSGGPVLLRIPAEAGAFLLAVLGVRRGRLEVLAPDLRRRRLDPERVAAAFRREAEAGVGPGIDRLLERARVPSRRLAQARRALLREQLGKTYLSDCWLLRPSPEASFWRQLRAAGVFRQLRRTLGFYALSYLLLLVSWWVLGGGVLAGRLDRGWLWAWGLVLFSALPPRLLSGWFQVKTAVGAGALLKRRLLHGTLRLDPDEIRHQGAGQLLGRVIESEAAETNALLGGFLAATATIELMLALVVLSQGSGGGWHVLALAVWAAVVCLLGSRYFARRQRWTAARLAMTHELVESLVGHRTRLAQEPPERWHLREDQLLDRYLGESRRIDRGQALFLSLVPRGWLLIGVAVLLPAFVAGGTTVAGLAVGVGGALMAYRGFGRLAEGFSYLAGSLISWQQAALLFHASARERRLGAPAAEAELADDLQRAGAGPMLAVRDLVFRHRGRSQPVLDGCSLEIHPGDRVLLEGPSGGGKSTLGSILAGLREPDSGLLVLGGLDRFTVGEKAWRRRIVLSPQFHENHVLSETLAFNLLMGRGWPPSPQDLAEAGEVCRELGLGDLLARMPAGLQQLVGETGWQLSHGERSRLFIARALLQRGDLAVLDESFASLDPLNLDLALDCVLARSRSLLLIAHD
jgi:ATP-binding cassette subfamily B protein